MRSGSKFLFLMLMLCAHSLGAHAEDPASLAQAGEWEKARAAYATQWKPGEDFPAAFYYDYGTAALHAASPGEAYALLLRAYRMDPLDSDARANLAAAYAKVNAIPRETHPASWISWWPGDLRVLPTKAFLVLGLAFLAPFLILARRAEGVARWVCGGLAFLFLLTSGFSAWDRRQGEGGLLKNAKVLSGPSSTFPEISSLEAGSLVNVEEARDGWYKVRYNSLRPGETVGWVEAANIVKLQ